MPILAEGDDEPNDTFREQLVASAEAAVHVSLPRALGTHFCLSKPFLEQDAGFTFFGVAAFVFDSARLR